MNRTGFKKYCYNDTSLNDERINCKNGYLWPFIFEPEPDINNETGICFIVNSNNQLCIFVCILLFVCFVFLKR